MPAQSLSTDAFVLLRRPPSDTFQSLTLFSATHGAILALQRVPKKAAATHTTVDLFDEASFLLETSNEGRTWFVKEARLLARPSGIARSYDTLRLASTLAALIARNHVHEESRPAVGLLLRNAFASFATAAPPGIVFFKSLYLFARDEGYPVKQEWLPTLSAALRADAARLLHTPLADLTKSEGQNPPPEILLTRRLEDYLRSSTEILFD